MRECVGRIYLGLSIVLLVSFLSLFLFNSKAQALFYCVGCPDGTNITCDGGAACPSFCNDGNAPNFFNCPTIDEALDCIAENTDMDAMILVAQGTHTGPGSTDVIDNTAMGADQSIQILGGFVPPTCALRSLNPNNTTVERPFDDRVFFIENTTSDNFSVRLEGMTITGGRTDGTTPDCPSGGALDDKNGAGVCATTTGSGDLDFTSFLNKYIDNITTNAGSGGGGLGVIAGGGGNITATIMDDAYTGNQAETFGGGMWFATDDTVFLDVSIDNATIGGSSVFPVEGNDAATGGGFSIFSTGGRIDVSNQGNTISNNSASAGSGGGIDILQSCGTCSPVTVSIDLDTITLNTASTGGGGVDIDAITTNSIINVSINKTIIGSNSATSSPGGGVRVQGNGEVNLFPVVNSCIFKNKTLSLLGGGGVAAVTSGNSADFDIKFVNNTIADNEANGATAVGGGILASSLGNTGVINWTLPNDLIFSNNAVGDGNEVALANTGANATLALRFTLTRLAAPGDLLGVNLGVIPATGFVNLLGNVINGNPQYIDPPSDNYRIPDTSPANGAGTSSATGTIAGNEAQPPADDFDGKPRPLPPSIGAYEPGPTPTPTPTATATATPIPTPTATPILTPTATPTVAPTVTATPTAFPTLTPPPTTPTLPPTTTPTIIPTPPNIVTIPNARNGALVTLISPLGTKLTDVDAFRTLQGCPDGFNGQFLNFPIGSFEFVVGGLQRGGSTTVEIILPPGTRINSFFKFGPEPDNPEPHCYEFLFDGFTGAEILSDRVVLHFIDGERGDGDLVPNGTIVEPGGPAFLSDEPLNGGGGCALAQTVQSGSALLNLVLPILPALAFGLRILRRKTLKG